MRYSVVQLAMCAAFSLPTLAVTAQAAKPLSSEQVLNLAGGVQLTAAADWIVARDGRMTTLASPERDTTLALLSVQAPDAAAAIKQAWATFRPGVSRVPQLLTREAARNGWDQRVSASYAVPPTERMVVTALALRKGSAWTVALLDGAEATVQKRDAAVALMLGSLRPEGYRDETFAGRKANPLDPARIARITGFLSSGMKRLQIPGVSFALLQDGKIVHVEGLGVRRHGSAQKVDGDTLFMAASNTKSMTTLLLARLADDGKLKWEQAVTDLYPAFRLGDADTTSRVQFRHLVCACTGLPRQDMEMMFEFGDATPASSVALLAAVKPTSKFGELYQYSNLMASAAGYIGGAIAYPGMELGAAYDRAMQERIFTPLGMQRTTFDMAAALRANHAAPHTLDYKGRLRVASTGLDASINPHRPAGGAWTSARDFIRYVQFEANEGRLANGERLISQENMLARRAPQISAGKGATYGMGLSTQLVSGVTVIHHGGSLPGYKSNFFLFPESGTGAVLLTNSDTGHGLLPAFQRYLLEELYNGKPEAAENVEIEGDAITAWYARPDKSTSMPPLRAVVRSLARRYRSAELGDLVISHQGRQTYLDTGEWKTAVATRKNADGSFSLRTVTPGMDGFEFLIGGSTGARSLVLNAGQQSYLFKEVAL